MESKSNQPIGDRESLVGKDSFGPVVKLAGDVSEEGIGVGYFHGRALGYAIKHLRDLIPSGSDNADLVAIPEGETAASIRSALRNGGHVGEVYLRVSVRPLSGPYYHS